MFDDCFSESSLFSSTVRFWIGEVGRYSRNRCLLEVQSECSLQLKFMSLGNAITSVIKICWKLILSYYKQTIIIIKSQSLEKIKLHAK